jgi:hypothetical protein
MSARSLGTFLILEGAIVVGLLLARAGCLHVLSTDELPALLRRRIERGNRVAPVVLVIALLALAAGAALLVLGA